MSEPLSQEICGGIWNLFAMSRVVLALPSLPCSDNLQLNLLSKEKQQNERKKNKRDWLKMCLKAVVESQPLEGFKDVLRLHLGTQFRGSLAVLDDQVDLIISEGFFQPQRFSKSLCGQIFLLCSLPLQTYR